MLAFYESYEEEIARITHWSMDGRTRVLGIVGAYQCARVLHSIYITKTLFDFWIGSVPRGVLRLSYIFKLNSLNGGDTYRSAWVL